MAPKPSPSTPAGEIGDLPSSREPAGELPLPKSPSELKANPTCRSFLSADAPEGDPETASDRTISFISGQIEIPLARDVRVNSTSGSVILDLVRNIIDVAAVSGDFMARATGNVGPIGKVSGFLCISAGGSIGKLEAGSGESTIVAKEIESVSSVSGRINIYGAHVKSVKSVSGQICLYDGASVDSVEMFSGSVGSCP